MRNNRSIYALALSLALVVATDAFASRARLLVLGTGDTGFLDGNGNGGSLYINDMYNIFYNPAYVSDYKDMAIIEKSNANGGAEGGFLTGIGGVTVGAYFNRVDSLATGMLNAATMKPVEVFVGGSHGVKWGLHFGYGYLTHRTWVSTNSAGVLAIRETSNSDYRASLGVSYMNFDPFIDLHVANQGMSPVASYTPNGTPQGFGTAANRPDYGKSWQDWKAGLKYTYGEWVPYAMYRSYKAGVMNADKGVSTWGLGFGRTMKGTESVNVNYGLSFWRVNQVRTSIPIEVSVEGKATSWLTLRGGMRYSLMDRLQSVDNGVATTYNQGTGQTSGRVGASFNFGRLDVDWTVGNDNTEGTESIDSATFDFSNNLFTAASVSYRW
jgi:hypothetical protein